MAISAGVKNIGVVNAVAKNKGYYLKLTRVWLVLSVLVSLVALTLENRVAQAEAFVEPAFEQQWNATDKAVANGQASRTYFWGPQAFAHTSEVYAESPNGGERRVQYFDKARMELTKKNGQDPNLVTNGLLTVELVTGQMQVGDNKFLQREPATNPVAGDQVGNSLAPTYATFNRQKLVFGVPGAVAAPDRTGQTVKEGLNWNGPVSTLTSTPVEVKYARYFSETGHNLADIFNNFFQKEPLGESKWLAVMGFPISEPFWVKDQVVVGGFTRDVMVQLFQRRVLTFTPSNPAAFQVEMGNIGQHYYVWRYGFDVRDQLPGNYRMIQPIGKTLYSIAVRNPQDKIKVGDAPDNITGLWALNEGRAVVATANGTYLADLTRQRAFKKLDLPAGLNQPYIIQALSSPDATRLVLLVGTKDKAIVQVYNTGTLANDNLTVNGTFTAYDGLSNDSTLKLSGDSRYLALVGNNNPTYVVDKVNVLDFSNGNKQTFNISVSQVEWIGKSSRLLVTASSTYKPNTPPDNPVVIPGKVSVVDVSNGNTNALLEAKNIRQAIPSPDGNYFALKLSQGDYPITYGSSSITSIISFRAFANPTFELAPLYEHNATGRDAYEPTLTGWSADGTYALVQSFVTNTGGSYQTRISLVSAVSGQAILKSDINWGYLGSLSFRLAAAFYTFTATHTYNGPGRPSDESIVMQNVDGSDKVTLYSAQIPSNDDTAARLAQVVQVPRV